MHVSSGWRAHPFWIVMPLLDSSGLTEYDFVRSWHSLPHPGTPPPLTSPPHTHAHLISILLASAPASDPGLGNDCGSFFVFSSPVQMLWRRGLQGLEQKPVPRLQRPGAPGLRGALHLLHPEHGRCGWARDRPAGHTAPILPTWSGPWEWAGGGGRLWQRGARWAASSVSEHLLSACMCGRGPRLRIPSALTTVLGRPGVPLLYPL